MKNKNQDRHSVGYHKKYWNKNKKRELFRNKEWRRKNKDKRREWEKEYYIKNMGKLKRNERKFNLRRNYNLTIEQYNEIFEKQNGKCAICNTHQSELKQTLAVDHNHITGQNRGLLCHRCNFGLGQFNESIELLEKAKQYLLNVY